MLMVIMAAKIELIRLNVITTQEFLPFKLIFSKHYFYYKYFIINIIITSHIISKFFIVFIRITQIGYINFKFNIKKKNNTFKSN